MTGIFISRGMQLHVPPGGLTIGDDGRAKLDLHLRYDVVPTWLGLAIVHAQEAQKRHAHLLEVWAGTDEEAKRQALEFEFVRSMQSIVAAATTFEALFANLKPICLPAETLQKWKEKRPKRFSQVAQLFGIAFSLTEKDVTGLSSNFKEIYKARDEAVHPPGTAQQSLLHPELKVGVEWRFARYRAANAEKAATCAANTVGELAFRRQPVNEAVAEYACSTDMYSEYMRVVLQPDTANEAQLVERRLAEMLKIRLGV